MVLSHQLQLVFYCHENLGFFHGIPRCSWCFPPVLPTMNVCVFFPPPVFCLCFTRKQLFFWWVPSVLPAKHLDVRTFFSLWFSCGFHLFQSNQSWFSFETSVFTGKINHGFPAVFPTKNTTSTSTGDVFTSGGCCKGSTLLGTRGTDGRRGGDEEMGALGRFGFV